MAGIVDAMHTAPLLPRPNARLQPPPAGNKTVFVRNLSMKMMILPRQARDKHGEHSKRDGFVAQWDRKFFDTTTVQLRLHGMSWADVWLLPEERETVQRLLLLLGEGGEQEGQGGAPAAAKE